MPIATNNSVLVNKQLQKLGFGTLKDPSLFDQMAMVIRDHTHFRRLLMAVDEGQRHIAYEALALKLRFKAKPLEDYITESKILAEQNQLPHYDPKTLVATEFKPQSFETDEYKRKVAVLPSGTVQDRSEGSRLSKAAEEVEYGCNCTSITGPSEHCEAHGAPFRERERQKELSKAAEEAIDRDLREASATEQCTLVCH